MDENQELQAETSESSAPEEKMLTQSQVNQIVQREKANAAAKATREAEQTYMRQAQQSQESQNVRAQPELSAQTANPAMDIDRDALYQEMQERMNRDMQQRQLEAEVQQVATNYQNKMADGKNSYQDFDEITADFDPGAFPQLIYLISGMDNAADVVYELSKNPSKLVTLDTLALRSPKQAQSELNRLSGSIKENQAAQQEAQGQNVNAPLDRIQPSNISSGNGKSSIGDLRSQPWLRG